MIKKSIALFCALLCTTHFFVASLLKKDAPVFNLQDFMVHDEIQILNHHLVSHNKLFVHNVSIHHQIILKLEKKLVHETEDRHQIEILSLIDQENKRFSEFLNSQKIEYRIVCKKSTLNFFSSQSTPFVLLKNRIRTRPFSPDASDDDA